MASGEERLTSGYSEEPDGTRQLCSETERLQIDNGKESEAANSRDSSLKDSALISSKDSSVNGTLEAGSTNDTCIEEEILEKWTDRNATELRDLKSTSNTLTSDDKCDSHVDDLTENYFEVCANLDKTNVETPEAVMEDLIMTSANGELVRDLRKDVNKMTENAVTERDSMNSHGEERDADGTNNSMVNENTGNDMEENLETSVEHGLNHEEANERGDGSDSSDTEGEYESADEGEEIQVDADQLKNLEESLTDEQKEEQRCFAQVLKEEGNELFRCGSYKSAIKVYSRALRTCPLKFAKDRSIMYSNRAVCKLKLTDNEAAIRDCTKALDLHPHYMKALMRRAELYEKTEKLEEALTDYQKIIELDPSQHSARAACMRLPEQIKERNEKMKEEMMGKLKDLGNLILRPFGLSTNNFQLNQDPNSGGYSVNFVQNPGEQQDS